MAISGDQYLVGYSKALDWRPLEFEDPFPRNRLCNLCGAIPRCTILLPCSHAVCNMCYEAAAEKRMCLIDKKKFHPEDAQRLLLPVHELRTRKVRCWNACHGCQFVGSVDGLRDHFQKNCLFHAVTCSNCDLSVLRTDLGSHLDTKYHSDVRKKSSSDASFPVYDDDKLGIKKALEDLKSEQLALKTSVDQLTELIKSNGLITDEDNDSADARPKERSKKTSLAAAYPQHYDSRTIHFYLGDFDRFKHQAQRSGASVVYSNPSDIYGYLIGLSCWLSKCSSDMWFGVYIRIYPGPFDSDLEWPFNKAFTLIVVHPENKSKNVCHEIDARKYPDKDTFQKPEGKSNDGFGRQELITLHRLEREGYVTCNTVHVALKVDI